MEERKVLLFSIEMDVNSFVNNDLQLSMQINCSEYMTQKESEEFQKLIGEASAIVRDAIIRKINAEDK
jgi:hypothetical protein